MSEPIRPALSAEEWGTGGEVRIERSTALVYQEGRHFPFVRVGRMCEYMVMIEGEDFHAMAAICLDGQPFGFTWDDVAALRLAEVDYPTPWAEAEKANARLRSLADRIEALLRPKKDENMSLRPDCDRDVPYDGGFGNGPSRCACGAWPEHVAGSSGRQIWCPTCGARLHRSKGNWRDAILAWDRLIAKPQFVAERKLIREAIDHDGYTQALEYLARKTLKLQAALRPRKDET